METLALVLSIVSGFVLTAPKGPAINVAATSAAINVALAPLTATIAVRRNRSGWLWLAIGLLFGMWGLAALLWVARVWIPRDSLPPSPNFPTSHAA